MSAPTIFATQLSCAVCKGTAAVVELEQFQDLNCKLLVNLDHGRNYLLIHFHGLIATSKGRKLLFSTSVSSPRIVPVSISPYTLRRPLNLSNLQILFEIT